MSQLPQIRRLLVEDFIDQKDWIAKLFTPINVFMDGTFGALNKSITLRENMAADYKKVTVGFVPTVDKPIAVSWDLPVPPISVHVGNVTKTDFTDFTLTTAVQVQWKYDNKQGFRLTNLVGITPTNATQYTLTLICFTG